MRERNSGVSKTYTKGQNAERKVVVATFVDEEGLKIILSTFNGLAMNKEAEEVLEYFSKKRKRCLTMEVKAKNRRKAEKNK